MDRLASMSVFLRVAELGSFSAAAEALGISPTMVGKHIRFLEDRLSARLLNRTTRRQSLTEIGRDYLERCRRVLDEAEAADAVADEVGRSPRGMLRVTAPVSFGSQRLAPALVEYMARYPDVTVDLMLNDRLVDILDEGFEVALRIGPLADSSLVARALKPYALVVCASPDYIREHGAPQHPGDLARHNCLGFAHWAPGDRWTFAGPEGELSVSIKSRYRINNGSALRAAALAGAGVILQAEALLKEDIDQGALVRVLPGYKPPSRPLHVVWLPDRRQTPKIRSFIDFVVARFG